LEHAHDVPGARSASGGPGAGGRAGAAADHRGDAGGDGYFYLLGADEVDVRVHAACRANHAFAGNHFGARSDHQRGVHSRLGKRVARLAQSDDPSVADADVAFDDAPVIKNHRTGDDQIEMRHAVLARGLAHALADHLAAAEDDFFTVDGVVFFDFDD